VIALVQSYTIAGGLILFIVQAVVITIGLLEFLPAPIVSALAVAVPLLSIIYSQHKRLEFSKPYTRRYTFHETIVTIDGRGDSNYLSAKRQIKYEMVALSPLPFQTFTLNRRGDLDPAYILDQEKPITASTSRSRSGNITVNNYRKTKQALSFDILFDPELRKNEVFSYEGSIHVLNYCAGDQASLQARHSMRVPAKNNSEMITRVINSPTRDFVFEVRIPVTYDTQGHHIEVEGEYKQKTRELEYITDKELFDASLVDALSEKYWSLKLVRKNPPIGITYRICWKPPEVLRND
jgi:hypothetical protein